MKDKDEVMWDATTKQLVDGYREQEKTYECLFCRKRFIKGNIYQINTSLYDAYGAIEQHVKAEHGETVDYLLKQNLSLLGISQVQQQILTFMSEGKDDKEISNALGITQSTVRNHRFKLREKEKQAKLYIALMASLEQKTKRLIEQTDSGLLEEVHMTAKMVDDRFNITDKEREKTCATYMDETGAIKLFPAKEKKKLIILREIMKNFERDRDYTEIEINTILKRIYDDYPTIRRALIEYGFFDRSRDCKVYRVKI